MFRKLKSVMPTAGKTEKQLLRDRWEAQASQNKEQHAREIAAQLLVDCKTLLNHVAGFSPRPPQGWQPLATAMLAAALERLDERSEGAGSAVQRAASAAPGDVAGQSLAVRPPALR